MPSQKSKGGNRQRGTDKSKSVKKNRDETSALIKSNKRTTNNELKESEKRLKLALEAGQMGIWEWVISDNSVQWSENVHELFGLSKDGFDGTFETYINLILPEDRPSVIRNINEAIRDMTTCRLEHRLRWPNGAIRWIESLGKITFDRKGRAVKVTGTIQDITKRKQIEYEREDWKARHELISKSAGLVIYDYDIRSGQIIWSGNCEEVLGYKPHELGNIDRWVELIHSDDRVEAFELLEEAQNEMRAYDVNYRFRKADGGFCYMHDRGFFVADNEGKAARMLGMMDDVTERMEAEKVIRESNRLRESIESAMPGILYVFNTLTRSNVYANKSSLTHLGYSPEELKAFGDEFVEKVIHPDDLKGLTSWDSEPDGTVKENEIRMLTKWGEYRWFMTWDTPFLRQANGKVIQIVGIAQDITARKEVINLLSKSEASYHELFETVGDAIYLQAESGHFIDVNKAASAMYGYDKKEMVGKTPEFLAAPEKNDLAQMKEYMVQALNGNPQTFEFWGKRKNGEEFLQEIKLTKGSHFGKDIIIATSRDITERRNAEVALKESEQRFRRLHEASFGGIGLHELGVIIDCNQGLCDLTGYSYEELKGFNGLDLIAPEWRPFVFEKIKSGYGKPYDVEGIKKDGTRYFLEIHGKNIPFHGRQIRVTEFRDITERKRNEEKIVEQNTKLLAVTDDLKRKNNQLEEFTQIVSHNLRSPVGNIVTLLNFFEGAVSENERLEYFNLLKESSAITLTMLNDINEVLKIKQNKNIEKQDLTFQTILDQVKMMLNAKITQLSAKIESDFSKAPMIHFPAIYLESILLNLLDNALKYSDPTRTPEISFRTYYNEKEQLILEVRDNGLGINLARYGHHMFKLRKTFHRHPESRGIGLFMIKNQIEAMGGEIGIDSKENAGSTFYVNFNKNQIDG
jgi:PAS domain S-box-containing protein